MEHGQLRRVVEVMDRLYSPGGCPWDRQQTHESLVPYLLEEAHELAEAIESGDRAHMREELGDVLLQVLFHSRVAEEEAEPFSVEDVARDLADKLVRRHPHVFVPDGADRSADDVVAGWDEIKKTEKQRTSVLEGIPLAQGALARAQKVVSRALKAGLFEPSDDDAAVAGDSGTPSGAEDRATRFGEDLLAAVRRAAGASPEDGPESSSTSAVPGPGPSRHAAASDISDDLSARYGAELLDLVRRAHADGVDAEQAMRAASRGLEARVRAAEGGSSQG